jgi:hypothetical protein
MNWDADYEKAKNSMGVEAVLRDDKGEVVTAMALILPQVPDPSPAEAVALWRAATLCDE